LILIVGSTVDLASVNVGKRLLEVCDFEESGETFQGNLTYSTSVDGKDVKYVQFNVEPVYTQNLTDFFSPELVIFISRHSSKSGLPTLTVHTPGNLGESQFGGLPREVSISPASSMKRALRELARLNDKLDLNYQVSYEGTHHGPSLNVPTMFVELGSSPVQWGDEKAALVVARSAIAALDGEDAEMNRTVLGIGGSHYNMKFTGLALKTDIAFGHMVPNYAVSILDRDLIRRCQECTLETVDACVLDWKGIRDEYKKSVIDMVEELGLTWEKV